MAELAVAGVQHDIAWEQPEANFDHLAPLVAEAAGNGARMIVLTEMYSHGFSMNKDGEVKRYSSIFILW